MMLFLLFHIPHLRKIFILVKNFPNFTFSKKVFDFHPAKFLMTFFSHLLGPYKFLISFPFLTVSVHFPLFRENYYFSPTFPNFSPDFAKGLRAFYIHFVFFVSL